MHRHINGAPFNPVLGAGVKLDSSDEITTIEGHRTRLARICTPCRGLAGHGRPQCATAKPGQIMAAVEPGQERGTDISDDDLDTLRNICRCGTLLPHS